MIVNCPTIRTPEGRYRCPWCGEEHPTDFKKNCEVYALAHGLRFHQGLGHTVTVLLAKRGITKEGGCDCAWREQFLNGLFPYKPKAWKRWLWKAGAILALPALIPVAIACSLYQWKAGQWDADAGDRAKAQEYWRRAREKQKG